MTRLEELHDEVADCRRCELYRDATQAVFSSGAARAAMLLVGEQPGDQEDREGEPFVGPAGRVLDEALATAGIDRASVYLTNAVKHFRFEQRGKRRIHQKPAVSHINACRPWLLEELKIVRPQVVVCLGATAARSVTGHPVRIGAERGQLQDHDAGWQYVVTTHPSTLLRLRDRSDYADELARLVDDLRVASDAC